MNLMIGLGLTGRNGGAAPVAPPPPAPASDPNVLAVRADGWTADYRVAGGAVPEAWGNRLPFDPNTDANSIYVQRPGFDATAAAVTVTDRLRIHTELRVPYDAAHGIGTYPLQRQAEGADALSRVTLSEYVYSGDVIPGVTNASTRDYPDPQVLWLMPDHGICGETLDLRIFVAHWHARQGRPVAAVRFRVSDGSSTAEQLVSTTVFQSYAASGLGCPAFAATLDVSGLADGALVVDAVVYPWVGPAYQLSVHGLSGDADMQARPMTVWKNPPRRYAYVTAAGTSGGSVSPDPALAAAAPFDSYANARAALVAANGDLSGCVLRFGPGAWVLPGGAAIATATAPFTMEPVDPADRATTLLQPTNTSVPNVNLAGKLVLRDLTLHRIAGTSTLLRAANTDTNPLVTDRCVFSNGGSGTRELFIRGGMRWWCIDCGMSGDFLNLFGASGTDKRMGINAFGCQGLGGQLTTNMIACASERGMDFADTSTNRTASSAGAVCAFNHLIKAAGTPRVGASGGFLTGTRRGIALVGNLFEWLSGTGPMVSLFEGGPAGRIVTNVVCQMNASPFGGDSGRCNFLYTFDGTCRMEGQMRFSLWPRWATKTDVFDSDASQTGGWPTAFHTGWQDNLMWEGESTPNAHLGAGSWRREAMERGLVFPPAALDPADLWETVAGLPTPKAASPLPTIEAGGAPYATDLRGTAIPDNGTALIGAVQRGDQLSS